MRRKVRGSQNGREIDLKENVGKNEEKSGNESGWAK